jgi:hypothetical protein
VNLFENDRRRFVLQFQQEMIERGWDTELQPYGAQSLALNISKNDGPERKLWAFTYNGKLCMTYRTPAGFQCYFYSAQEFADYAYEHKL